MPSANTQPARGMRDFLPEDVRKREYVMGVIKNVYEGYGFEPLETPAVENIETLMGKYGEEGNQLIFKILKRGIHEATGEADLALRYDLTVPLARVVAEYRDKLPKFFKRYQIQPVWRADRPARGRFREFYQCDVDVLGSRSMVVEAEICAAASEVLTKLGFSDFTIKLNHRKILTSILEHFAIPQTQHVNALVALDKFHKIGIEGTRKELANKGILEKSAERLLEYVAEEEDLEAERETYPRWGPGRGPELYNQAVLKKVMEDWITDPEGASGVTDLMKVLELAGAAGIGNRVRIRLSLARGLSYYTGSIFEISVPEIAGSLGGGGRYDNLVGMFLGQNIPACGLSLGLERIIVVMTERDMFPPGLISSPAEVMVAVWNETSSGESITLASELRAGNLRVEIYPDADKLGKQFKYASSRRIPFVAVIGDDERARGEVTIKDLRTGEQHTVKRDSVLARLRESL